MSTPGNDEVGESPSHRHKTRSYAVGSFALELGEEPTRPRGQGILIGLLVFLLLSLFLFAFSLFGPGGDVRRFFDVFLPGDPTFVVASPRDGGVVIFGDGVSGRRLPDGNMPYCEQVMMTQDKLGGSFFDVFFDVFFWTNKTRLMVGSNPLCGDPDGITQPASTPGTSSGGHCQDKCDPNDPNSCLAGLSCVPRSTAAASGYICYNQQICNPSMTQEPTEAISTAPPCVCGDGVCEQARCNELQQNCPADCGSGQPQPPTKPCDKSCGNGACEPNCQEDTATCPADCKEP
jgi:hypothetical protein